jgi:hypothetical protein
MPLTRLSYFTLGALGVLLGTVQLATAVVGYHVVTGVGLLVAGVLLGCAGLFPGLRLGAYGWTVVGLVALAGILAGLLVNHASLMAQFDLRRSFGYPYPWLFRHAWYDTDPHGMPDRVDWTHSGGPLGADLLFWASVGVLPGIGAARWSRSRAVAAQENVTAAP